MKKTIYICYGETCKRNAEMLMKTAQNKVQKEYLGKTVEIDQCYCLGQCEKGPNIQVESGFGERKVKNSVSPRGIEEQIDFLSGKKKEGTQKHGEAKNALDNLLSGGF